jgi:RNA polymerase sigma-70 factor (ECF subfamily)
VLRLLFACCHPAIRPEAQMALALKTVCGLSTGEIAKAFLTGEETITKRIYRAREKIRTEKIELDLPPLVEMQSRLEAVWHCLYLLFNEGYNSSHPDQLIRAELCEEAMRLALPAFATKIFKHAPHLCPAFPVLFPGIAV